VHHVLVVAFETDQVHACRLSGHQVLDNLTTLGATIDIVAQGYDFEGSTARVLGNGGKGRLQEIKSAVQIRDDISQGHAELQKTQQNRFKSKAPRCAKPHRIHFPALTSRRPWWFRSFAD
jgi:hypothetical protein